MSPTVAAYIRVPARVLPPSHTSEGIITPGSTTAAPAGNATASKVSSSSDGVHVNLSHVSSCKIATIKELRIAPTRRTLDPLDIQAQVGQPGTTYLKSDNRCAYMGIPDGLNDFFWEPTVMGLQLLKSDEQIVETKYR
ncbi:hypothetical protein CSKR_112038 [Clonorchis sinensis]|uniref:Uncharacterized protein n=1 Tax=Clonorchis sinensis TaxID=79923 RepID=A0A419PNR3_CLOSI|nr:hypothetical protein CSKR_112038 [Clonorchis sinensis]